ncbi:MAG: hypothetical protein H7333_10935 [Bdellovibrionales bacterium]|nr:hypothetical protein [Oligoflexia bacterium]
MEKEPARKSMRWAIDRFGSEVTFRILFFSFLHANFTRIQLEAIPFETILGLAFLGAEASKPKSDREIKQLKTVFRIGFDLDPAFTLFTNAFCLRLMGVKHEFMDLLDFHFLEFFEQKKYRNLLCAMSQLFQPKADDPRKGIQHVQ